MVIYYGEVCFETGFDYPFDQYALKVDREILYHKIEYKNRSISMPMNNHEKRNI